MNDLEHGVAKTCAQADTVAPAPSPTVSARWRISEHPARQSHIYSGPKEARPPVARLACERAAGGVFAHARPLHDAGGWRGSVAR